jgi:hypothetical protein
MSQACIVAPGEAGRIVLSRSRGDPAICGKEIHSSYLNRPRCRQTMPPIVHRPGCMPNLGFRNWSAIRGIASQPATRYLAAESQVKSKPRRRISHLGQRTSHECWIAVTPSHSKVVRHSGTVLRCMEPTSRCRSNGFRPKDFRRVRSSRAQPRGGPWGGYPSDGRGCGRARIGTVVNGE